MPSPQKPADSSSADSPPAPPEPVEDSARGGASDRRSTAAAWAAGVGFAVAAVAVAAVVWVVVSGPAMRFVTASGDSDLDASIRDAADAVHRTLAERPVSAGEATRTGSAPLWLLDALEYRTGLTWRTPDTTGGGWALQPDDGPTIIRVQLIVPANGAADPSPAAANRSLTASWVAPTALPVRVHAQDADGGWACAIVVAAARHSPVEPLTAAAAAQRAAEGDLDPLLYDRLKGIWYDAGRRIDADPGGVSHCSPTLPEPQSLPADVYGNHQITGRTTGFEPLPVSDVAWNIPAHPHPDGGGAIPAAAWQRATPPAP